MRKIKASSSYPKKQARKNLAKAILWLLVFFVAAAFWGWHAIATWQFGLLEQISLIVLFAPVGVFYFYLHEYRVYSGGVEGEKQVAQLLSRTLSNDYYLVNDLYLQGSRGGDIDHVVLGPNGIFVLETKNWSGKITVVEDLWHRAGKRNLHGSPSRQAKNNAGKIKRLIDMSSKLRGLELGVAGIVVLTNRHASVQLNSPTVPILRLHQLPDYIKGYGSQKRYSSDVLERIGEEIVKQKA